MNKSGLVILVGSIAAAALLTVLWLIGFLFAVGGNLVHLLIVLALPVGFIGGILGIILMLTGKKSRQP
jgi:hypothetical protein